MQPGKIKKIAKWFFISCFILSGTIILFFLIFPSNLKYLNLRYWNKRSMQKSNGYNYLISGRGCNDMYKSSDNDLKKYIEENILNEINKKKFEKILLDKKKKYNNGEYMHSSCELMIDRALEITSSL